MDSGTVLPSFDADFKPRLRPIEPFHRPERDGAPIGLRDRSGFSPAVLSVSEGALWLISLMDGRRTLAAIREEFVNATTVDLPMATLTALVGQLDRVMFLDGPTFDEQYTRLQRAYRERGRRPPRHVTHLVGSGRAATWFDQLLDSSSSTPVHDPVLGLVVPHLDYERGASCYAAGYSTLRKRRVPDRVIILGTNHFGRSTSVVSTASAFETPCGVSAADIDLLDRLERKCGFLRDCEFDHEREHSVELQVAWLQHLFGADRFRMLAFLCPDPCGPSGAAPIDGRGIDLKRFSIAVRESLHEIGGDTLLIAGADLSHVGATFGDEGPLDDTLLDRAARRDLEVLDWLGQGSLDQFVACVAADDNATRICSMGCMYVLATILHGAIVTRLRYHQAADRESNTCVTCAALVYTAPP